MKRPYEGKEGSKEQKALLPGESETYLFNLPTPMDNNQANSLSVGLSNLYVLGWIGYKDDLGIYRVTAFCLGEPRDVGSLHRLLNFSEFLLC